MVSRPGIRVRGGHFLSMCARNRRAHQPGPPGDGFRL